MYLLSALSSRIELNARCRARSTSDKYSIIRSAFERVSGSVHSKGSSHRLAVNPPQVCSITAALRRMFSPMLTAGGFLYSRSEGTDLTSSFRLSTKSANSRSNTLTMSRLSLVRRLLSSRASISFFHHGSKAATFDSEAVVNVTFRSDARAA